MLKRTLSLLDKAPMFWVAVGLGLVIFSVNRMLPEMNWDAVSSEQSVLDQAFSHNLQQGNWSYHVLPDTPQTYGAHVLTQYLRAALSIVTGDSGRAGVWLSLLGITATLCGLYPLSLRIFPLRGFAVITVMCAGALGAIQFSLSTDPSAAIGTAFVVWGMVFFLTALTKHHPYDIFASGLLFGLAGYIRIELSMMWVFLAVYLMVLSIFPPSKKREDTGYVSMALGGVITVLIVLWPMIHRNIQLAGTPILPGFDAEIVLGAPSLSGQADPESFVLRLLQGLKILVLNFRGPGIFVGLLWPIGIVICLLMGRHQKIPYFWLPIVTSMFLCLSALSYVTGFQSFQESLLILSPLLLPFAILPLAYALHRWMQEKTRSPAQCRTVWASAGLGLFLLIQLPHFLHFAPSGTPELEQQRVVLVEEFSRLPHQQTSAMLISDTPGTFLTGGKSTVIGMNGETDWQILTAKYANGEFQYDKLLAYMKNKQVKFIHLSDVEDPLVDFLALEPNAPSISPVTSFSPPHRVFRVDWL